MPSCYIDMGRHVILRQIMRRSLWSILKCLGPPGQWLFSPLLQSGGGSGLYLPDGRSWTGSNRCAVSSDLGKGHAMCIGCIRTEN